MDVLTDLDPSISECIDASLKQVSDKLGLQYEVKQITKQFSKNIINIIDISGKLFITFTINVVIYRNIFVARTQIGYNIFS